MGAFWSCFLYLRVHFPMNWRSLRIRSGIKFTRVWQLGCPIALGNKFLVRATMIYRRVARPGKVQIISKLTLILSHMLQTSKIILISYKPSTYSNFLTWHMYVLLFGQVWANSGRATKKIVAAWSLQCFDIKLAVTSTVSQHDLIWSLCVHDATSRLHMYASYEISKCKNLDWADSLHHCLKLEMMHPVVFFTLYHQKVLVQKQLANSTICKFKKKNDNNNNKNTTTT